MRDADDVEYGELSEEQLLLELGKLVAGKGMIRLPDAVLVLKARDWINANLAAIREKICNNQQVHVAINADVTTVVIATIDTAIGTTFLPIPAALISHYCVKVGFKRICGGARP